MSHKKPLAVLLLMSLGPLAVADELQGLYGDEDAAGPYYSQEELISIATGHKQRISKAPSVASVLTAEDLRKMGARDLSDALEAIPGLHVNLSSDRFAPSYSIRGISTFFNPHVLVLMNGVPTTQVFGGDRGDLFELPVADISRIEVIRGPGSAVYGADAFAGTINIITKSAGEIDGTEAGVRLGSFDTGNAWLLHGGKVGDWDLAFGIEAHHTNGDPGRIISSDLQSFFDGIMGTSASLAPGPAETRREIVDTHLELSKDEWALRFWNWRLINGGVGPGVAFALDPTGRVDADNYLIDLSYQREASGSPWRIESRLNYYNARTETSQTLLPAGTVLPIGSDGNIDFATPAGIVTFTDGYIGNPSVFEQRLGLDAAATYTGLTDHRLRLGAGASTANVEAAESKNFGPGVIDGTVPVIDGAVTDVTGTPFAYIPNKSRQVQYVSAQDEWTFAPDWSLTGGIRYDNYSDFGSTLNPRLALVWNTTYNLTTKLLYGRAFRAPAFYELYGSNNPVGRGNPDLQPETIDTWEMAFSWQPRFDLNTSINLFSYDIEDLIRFVPDATGSTLTTQNAGGQRGHGFEIEATWKASEQLKLLGNFSWQQPEDKQTHDTVADVPGHQLYFGADLAFLPDWSLSGRINYVADRSRVAGDPRAPVGDYTTVDAILNRKGVAKNLDFTLTVHNLLDENVLEPSVGDPSYPLGSSVPGDFPREGRSIYGELRYNF